MDRPENAALSPKKPGGRRPQNFKWFCIPGKNPEDLPGATGAPAASVEGPCKLRYIWLHRIDERNRREKERLWISRAYREKTRILNPEKTEGKPAKIKQKQSDNQRNTKTLENPRAFLSLEVACNQALLGEYDISRDTRRETKHQEVERQISTLPGLRGDV